MFTNADCTVYHLQLNEETKKKEYVRTTVEDIHWFVKNDRLLTDKGYVHNDHLTLRIPDTSAIIAKGDIVVHGVVETEISSIKDLGGYEVFIVTDFNYNLDGSEPHIRVGGDR